MDTKVAEHVAEVMKAVAHPVRLGIVELLETREMCVGDIVAAIGGKQAIGPGADPEPPVVVDPQHRDVVVQIFRQQWIEH